jgi:hypothetical protein
MKKWQHRVLTVINQSDAGCWPTDAELQTALDEAGAEGYGIDSVEYLELSEDSVGVQVVMSRAAKGK